MTLWECSGMAFDPEETKSDYPSEKGRFKPIRFKRLLLPDSEHFVENQSRDDPRGRPKQTPSPFPTSTAGCPGRFTNYFQNDLRQGGQVIHGATDVFHSGRGIFKQALFAFAFSPMRSVIGQRYEAPRGELFSVQAGSLFLDPASGGNADDRGIPSVCMFSGKNRCPAILRLLFLNVIFSM
jgi:hypothetical protein